MTPCDEEIEDSIKSLLLILSGRKKMDIVQIANEIIKNSNDIDANVAPNTETTEKKQNSRFQCTSRFRKCIVTCCYLIFLLMCLTELIRSIGKEADLADLVNTITHFVVNVSRNTAERSVESGPESPVLQAPIKGAPTDFAPSSD